MKITLRDEVREFPQGTTVAEVAGAISEGLKRAALVAKVNGEVVDLATPLTKDSTVEILTVKDPEGLQAYRHTAAHILAQAVKRIFPTAKLAIGPAIQNGFYYDFEFKTPVTRDQLPQIEDEMKKIVKSNIELTREEVTRNEAIRIMREMGETYKIELIKDIPEGELITLYRQGDYLDLCAGPHVPSTGYIKAFKLTSVTGAYWRGDEHNKMLTRIYGTAFGKKQELEDYLVALEEAKKRDHNKLGREMGIFMTDENIGQGLPLLMPKGAKLFQILNRFVEDEEARRGYVLTKTPYMAKSNLYKISEQIGRAHV